MTLPNLRKALDHLERAEEEANLGTRLMIQPIREELANIIQRRENINEEERE
jgi:hypothetical protein